MLLFLCCHPERFSNCCRVDFHRTTQKDAAHASVSTLLIMHWLVQRENAACVWQVCYCLDNCCVMITYHCLITAALYLTHFLVFTCPLQKDTEHHQQHCLLAELCDIGLSSVYLMVVWTRCTAELMVRCCCLYKDVIPAMLLLSLIITDQRLHVKGHIEHQDLRRFGFLTCSCPSMMTPPGLIGCQAARLSPVPSFAPFW